MEIVKLPKSARETIANVVCENNRFSGNDDSTEALKCDKTIIKFAKSEAITSVNTFSDSKMWS